MVHQGADLTHASLPLFLDPKHLPNMEMRFYCPQAFLSLDIHFRMDLAESK